VLLFWFFSLSGFFVFFFWFFSLSGFSASFSESLLFLSACLCLCMIKSIRDAGGFYKPAIEKTELIDWIFDDILRKWLAGRPTYSPDGTYDNDCHLMLNNIIDSRQLKRYNVLINQKEKR